MTNLDSDLVVERYKHVLGQMTRIDEGAHKFLSLFQVTVTALLGAGGSLWLLHVEWGIGLAEARLAIELILALIAGLGLFTAALLVIGMFAWMDYRREEAALAANAASSRRSPGSWKHLWRWQEFYMILLVLAVSLAALLTGWLLVLPSLA